MVAYSFKARFAELILAGTKRQTIRAIGKRRHADPGNMLQLYTGMRTKNCRLIAERKCLALEGIRIQWWAGDYQSIYVQGAPIPADEQDNFAHRDGFQDMAEMREFWRVNHPGIVDFVGVLIKW